MGLENKIILQKIERIPLKFQRLTKIQMEALFRFLVQIKFKDIVMITKTFNKQVFTLLVLLLVITNCKSQQVLPLSTSAFSSPNNSYFKDLNNELDSYVGIWQATFKEKTILLKVTKEQKVPFEIWGKNNFKDRLLVRYEIKNNNGTILESSLNNDFSNKVKLLIEGSEIENDLATLIFAGGNCSVGIGNITFKKINNTQFYWSYYPGTTTSNYINCPPNLDYNIYLPEAENLIFTKQ